MNPVNLGVKLATFADHWQARTIGQFNGHDLMVVKAKGTPNAGDPATAAARRVI